MDLVTDHMISELDRFISEAEPYFDMVYNEIQNPCKADYKKLLFYLNKILDRAHQTDNTELQCVHIHLDKELNEDAKLLFSEFLIIKQFFSQSNADEKDDLSEMFKDYIVSLESKLRTFGDCPEGASGKNGGNKIFKLWLNEKRALSARLKFLKAIPWNSTFVPKTILNLQTKTFNKLIDLFQDKMFGIGINESNGLFSYVLLNNLELRELKGKKLGNTYLLKLVKDIILFDCESSVRTFSEFHFGFLANLNRNHNTGFKNLDIITFSRNDSNSNSARNKIDLIKNRYGVPLNSSYAILKEEVLHLLHQNLIHPLEVHLIGPETSTFWEVFILETSIRDLYELRSIKMLNIYSLAFNNDIKDYIIDDIFSRKETSKLLSFQTYQELTELSDEILHHLKQSLSQVIDQIIQHNWKGQVANIMGKGSLVLLPDEVFRDLTLKNKIIKAMGLDSPSRLFSWDNIDPSTNQPVLILAYRDPGNPPYYFYPNIFENDFTNRASVSTVFLRVFWEQQYRWAKYNFNKNKHRLLDHSIRRNAFEWSSLAEKIKLLKPVKPYSFFWDLENSYSNSEIRTIIKVRFKGDKNLRSFSPSDLFIIGHADEERFRVERISDLIDINTAEQKIEIQHLEEIQDKINIYETFNDNEKQEEELRLINRQFNIDEKEPGRLWKVLLRDLAKKRGEASLYSELSQDLANKGLNIVSFFHFKSTWLEPDSASLTPLSKKVFISLCDFLQIPRTYVVIMQRIKNTSTQATKHSRRQMNHLLKDLFNDGCFDKLSRTDDILKENIEKYREQHPPEDFGIEEEHLFVNLLSLVELIQPEIKLVELEKIEIITQ